MKFGAGFRREISNWISSRPKQLQILEITAEHFFYGRGRKTLKKISGAYPVCVHGLSLSLGTEGPLIADHVAEFADVARACKPLWISEHIAKTRTHEFALGHLTPIPRTEESIAIVADHAIELSEACGGVPIILENITSHIPGDEPIPEPEFLNRICERANCGLLLDVTNLAVNSFNHKFDPYVWMNEIEAPVRQMHVVGFSEHNGIAFDCHSQDLSSNKKLRNLIHFAIEHFKPEAVILERDENFPAEANLDSEMETLNEFAPAPAY